MTRSDHGWAQVTTLGLALLWACNPPPQGTCEGGDYVAEEGDFDCLWDWPEVAGVRVLNRCGQQTRAESILRDELRGERFPVGTILQLLPDEAMVKRASGYDPSHQDWEFFQLGGTPAGGRIKARGRAEVRNQAGSCAECHAGAASWDYRCGEGHGCPPLPVPHAVLRSNQDRDVRCLPP